MDGWIVLLYSTGHRKCGVSNYQQAINHGIFAWIRDNSRCWSDKIANNLDSDDDNDNFTDSLDSCPLEFGNSSVDQGGCPDIDGDGYSNLGDAFPNDISQYSDEDGDGYGIILRVQDLTLVLLNMVNRTKMEH